MEPDRRQSLGVSGHAALLAWANTVMVTGPIKAHVTNFTSSWGDGRALCALVSAIDVDAAAAVADCRHSTAEERLAALRVAIDTLQERGVPALMDPEDFAVRSVAKFSLGSFSDVFVARRGPFLSQPVGGGRP